MQGGGSCVKERCGRYEEYKPSEAGHSGRLATINIVPEIKRQEKMIPVTESRARESCCFMRWSKSSWGFFRWISCSSYFISYQPFHSPCSCVSRSPGSAERACGASPWQRWPPCWCPALPLGQDAALQQQLAGQVASEEENGVQHTFNIKVGKYSERCEAEGIVFIPLVVDRFGGWHKDSLEISPNWVSVFHQNLCFS